MNLLLLQGSRAADLKERWFHVQQTSCGFQWKHKLKASLPVLELIKPTVERAPNAGNLLPSLPVQQLFGQHVAHKHIDFMNHTPYFTEYFLQNRKGVTIRPQGAATKFTNSHEELVSCFLLQ